MMMKPLQFLKLMISAAAAAVLAGWPCAVLCEELDIPRMEYAADSYRDPFKSYIEKVVVDPNKKEPEPEIIAKPFPTLEIEGVFWGGKYPVALINNKIWKEGDVLEEAQIRTIDKQRITFLFGNRQYEQALSAAQATLLSVSQKEAQ